MRARRIFGKEYGFFGAPINLEQIAEISEKASKQRKILSQMPYDKIFLVLDKLKEKWANPSYERRIRMMEELPALTGFSSKMIERGLNELPFLFDSELLKQKLNTELQGISYNETGTLKGSTRLQWKPLGFMLHVLSGNVFLVGPGSLVEGLISRNVNLLKLSSDEKVFMPELLDSIREIEEELSWNSELSNSIGLIDYSSTDNKIISALKKEVDAIVLWGGEAAARAYRENLPARVKFILFGPKYSLALITEKGLQENGIQKTAQSLAKELSIWDQSACTAPQICYLERGSSSDSFLKALSSAMQLESEKTPPGQPHENQAAEIQKLRSIYEWGSIEGKQKLFASKNSCDWTLLVSQDLNPEMSPLHRCLKIANFESFEEVENALSSMRSYIQTVGLSCSSEESGFYEDHFLDLGALRVLELGTMGAGEIDDPHDGSYALPHFFNLVASRINKNPRIALHLNKKNRQEHLNSKLRTLLAHAKKAPFYSKALKRPPQNLKDLKDLPILSREDYELKMYPHTKELIAHKELLGGHVTRSGGSTGTPKYSYFDNKDWSAMIQNAVEIFKAAGFNSQDKVVNCMFSGNLYGSFLSFSDVFSQMKMQSFPLSSYLKAEILIELIKNFQINTLVGPPPSIMPLLRESYKQDPSFSIPKIMYAGQPLKNTERTWLKETLQTQIIASIIGTTEAGQIGYQDENCQGQEHWSIDEYNYLEIVDEDGCPVQGSQEGRLIVTNLEKFCIPLIRFDIGDRARWIEEDSFGKRKFELLGRDHSYVSIGGLNLDLIALEKVLENNFPSIDFQILGDQMKDGRDLLSVLVASNSETPKSLEEKIQNCFHSKVPEFSETLPKNLMNFEINFVSEKDFIKNERTGKQKFFIDRRFQQDNS